MKATWILFTIALTISPAALASNWIAVTRGPVADVFYDLQGLIFDHDQRTVWVKYIYKHPQKLGDTKKTFFVDISYEGFNCARRINAVYEQVFYDKIGNVISQSIYNYNPPWEPIVPDSYGDLTATALCVKPDIDNSSTEPPSSTTVQPTAIAPPPPR